MTDEGRDNTVPQISIVVPAKDEARFIRPCLRSIREQWFNGWECLIVDDGSQDETLDIAEEFAEKDSRFRVISHAESRGLAAARNTGIASTSAPYLTFLDADDFLYQHALRRRLESLSTLERPTVAGSYCDWQPTREKQGRNPPEREPADRHKLLGFVHGPECPFIATAPLVRRDIIEEMGGFDETLPTAEDFDLWVRILRAGYTFVYTPVVGVAYRQKSSGMIFSGTAFHARASGKIIDDQYVDLSGSPDAPLLAKPISHYQREHTQARRLLRSFAIAAAADDADGQEEIKALLRSPISILERAGLDVRGELRAGLSRASRAFPALASAEAKDQAVDELVGKIATD